MESCSSLAPALAVKSFKLAAEISRHLAADSRMSSKDTVILQTALSCRCKACHRLPVTYGCNVGKGFTAGCLDDLKVNQAVPYCKALTPPLSALQDWSCADTANSAGSTESTRYLSHAPGMGMLYYLAVLALGCGAGTPTYIPRFNR